MPGAQGPIFGLRVHPSLKRAHPRPEGGPEKLRWVKNYKFSFLRGVPLDQEALPWLIPLPPPELWLRSCGIRRAVGAAGAPAIHYASEAQR